ncbi:OsmC family protein [Cognatiluteimonas weifangensis]|uniref:OsmC family peroxiredoxin n=1 Tax=Cognatiluteimonas weifangensis TaxID=2303539 RepID=A0A372DRH0_9GAMM|nr:OsmC family protein [Luteimonas weifangensis]RFP61997.1 OsmC family peroxiredoxin [Luteimonas weifangensis]
MNATVRPSVAAGDAGESIRLSLEQDGDFAFRIRFDDTALEPLLSDEPAPLGHDRGPNPSRLLLASIANCLSASLLFALRKHRNAPDPLRATITAATVRNADGRWRIPRAAVQIVLPGGGEDYRNLERVLAQFEQFCVVTQSVREGIDVAVTVSDGQGRVLHATGGASAGA